METVNLYDAETNLSRLAPPKLGPLAGQRHWVGADFEDPLPDDMAME